MKKRLRCLGAAFLVLSALSGAFPTTAQAGLYDAWAYRLKLSFTNPVGGTLTNFPVLVTLSTGIPGFQYTDFTNAASGADLRFADSGEAVNLSYEIETWNPAGTSYVWVQVPRVAGTNEYLYAYWGYNTNAPASQTNGTTWTNGYVGVWHMGEAVATNYDSTTNHNDGVKAGNTTATAAGQIGSAQVFDGSNDYVNCGTLPSLDVALPRTISAWINPAVITTNACVICKDNGRNTPYSYIMCCTTGGMVSAYDNSGTWRISTNAGIGPGNWYHVAYETRGDNLVRFYVNGQSAGTATWSHVDTAAHTVYIGSWYSVNNAYDFNGAIDEVSISGVARGSNWVYASYLNQKAGSSFVTYGTASKVSVVALPVSNLGATGARMNGQVIRTGAENPAVFVCWDATDQGTSSTGAWAHVDYVGTNWGAGQTFSSVVSGLLVSSNTYVYRCYATNSTGESWSDTAVGFRAAYVPAVSNSGAVVLNPTAALLQGTVTDTGIETPTVSFLYWVSGSGVTNLVSAGSQAGACSAVATGLQASSDYVFMAMASNSAGVAYSGTNGFRTTTLYYVATNGLDTGANDGLSWAQPYKTISNGIAHATGTRDGVMVSNGVHLIGASIVVTNAITVMSFTAASNTIVDATNGAWRCFWVSNNLAVIKGLTIQNGRAPGSTDAGGGMMLAAGTVESCIIRSNTTTSGNAYGAGVQIVGANGATALLTNCLITLNRCGGGGVGVYSRVNASARIVNCTISSNTATANATSGGGFNINGTLENCSIVGNTALSDADVAAGVGNSATLRNCLIAGNFTASQSGVSMSGGTVENCTFVGNRSENGTVPSALLIDGSTVVRNTVIYGNIGPGPEFRSSAATNMTRSLVNPAVSGTGNLTGDPLFVWAAAGDYRLRPDSPCLNKGANQAWMSTVSDLDGNPRIFPVSGGTNDMGCYERPLDALSCVPVASVVNGTDPLQVVLTAVPGGSDQTGLYYRWGFTNSTVVDAQGSDKQVVTNNYGLGTWSVTLSVSNAAGQVASMTLTNLIKVGAANIYVRTNGVPVWPYASWATAATNIQTAVDLGAVGSTVWVSNGTYAVGATINVQEGLTLKSLNGLGTVTLDGGNAVGCLLVNHTNAVIDGLTIIRGSRGIGAGLRLTAGTAQRCLIATNVSGAVNVLYRGVLRDSTIDKNTPSGNNNYSGVTSQSEIKGSGQVDGGLIENCIIRGGGNCHYGAVYMTRATIRNCLIVGNKGTSEGGDANNWYKGGLVSYGCTVENCTITSNQVMTGGANISGVYADGSTKFYNTIIYGNRNSLGAVAPTNYTFLGATPAVYNSLLEPAYATAVNSTNGDPSLNGDFTLSSSSPCINKGSNLTWMTTTRTNDLAGNRRVQGSAPDMGAYEFNVSTLSCGFGVSTTAVFELGLVTFTATVSGDDTNNVYYRWSFSDPGVVNLEGYNLGTLTTNLGAGSHSVTLVASNSSGTATFTYPTSIKVAPPVAYVVTNGLSTPTFPYSSWATASTNIQMAVDAGIAGTLVLVSNGVYTLPARLNNSAGLTLRSVNGRGVTTLNGSGSIQCYWSGLDSSVLDGFTITNGYSSGGGAASLQGGAILNCLIVNNRGVGGDAGAVQVGGAVLVSNCVFIGNSTSGGLGGGLGGAAAATVVDCVFSNNTSPSTAAVYLPSGGRLRNCLIARNTSGNWGGRSGAAVQIAGVGAIVENCTIVSNSTTHITSPGGLEADANADLYNTIVWGNTSTNATPNYLGGHAAYNCDVSPAWSGLGSSNLCADPQFVSATNGNYDILFGSPCRNAGSNLTWAVASGVMDLAGRKRRFGARVDIGAYEVQGEPGTIFTMR